MVGTLGHLTWLLEACLAMEAGATGPALLHHLRFGGAEAPAAAALYRLASQRPSCSGTLLAHGAVATFVGVLQRAAVPGSSQDREFAAHWAALTLALPAQAADPRAFSAAIRGSGALDAMRQLLDSARHPTVREAMELARHLISQLHEPSASQAQVVVPTAIDLPGPAAQPAPQPAGQRAAVPPARPPAPRVCAAPGCGAMRGLRRCGGCGTVRYCSTACSRAHWREHRAECRRLQAEQAAGAEAGAGSSGGGVAAPSS